MISWPSMWSPTAQRTTKWPCRPSWLASTRWVEKPLGNYMRACQAMIDAARTGGAVLATAENYRRDPPNRLARAIVESGLLGDPFLMIQGIGRRQRQHNHHALAPSKGKGGPLAWTWESTTATSSNTTWGDYAHVFGGGFIVEPCGAGQKATTITPPRILTASGPRPYPDTVEATGEDSVVALVQNAVRCAGAARAGGGSRWSGRERSVHGRWGALYSPGDRNGRPVVLRLEGKELKGREILSLLPDFHLDEITERLFGADGVEYDHFRSILLRNRLPALGHRVPRLCQAILTGGQPEVDGLGGCRPSRRLVGAYESALRRAFAVYGGDSERGRAGLSARHRRGTWVGLKGRHHDPKRLLAHFVIRDGL